MTHKTAGEKTYQKFIKIWKELILFVKNHESRLKLHFPVQTLKQPSGGLLVAITMD